VLIIWWRFIEIKIWISDKRPAQFQPRSLNVRISRFTREGIDKSSRQRWNSTRASWIRLPAVRPIGRVSSALRDSTQHRRHVDNKSIVSRARHREVTHRVCAVRFGAVYPHRALHQHQLQWLRRLHLFIIDRRSSTTAFISTKIKSIRRTVEQASLKINPWKQNVCLLGNVTNYVGVCASWFVLMCPVSNYYYYYYYSAVLDCAYLYDRVLRRLHTNSIVRVMPSHRHSPTKNSFT